MMRFSRYAGNPNIGVFAAVNENLAFIAGDAAPEFVNDIGEALQVETTQMTVAGSFVIGSLVVMNSNGAVVSGQIDSRELGIIGEHIRCTPIDDPLNAAGNNILANDSGAIVNPEYPRQIVGIISDALGVECVPSAIAGISTVGSVCIATNRGCVCHADASDEDLELIRDVLKVDAVRSSVNHGSRMVGAGILANSKGALIGDTTTPIEMGKIEEGLALYRSAVEDPAFLVLRQIRRCDLQLVADEIDGFVRYHIQEFIHRGQSEGQSADHEMHGDDDPGIHEFDELLDLRHLHGVDLSDRDEEEIHPLYGIDDVLRGDASQVPAVAQRDAVHFEPVDRVGSPLRPLAVVMP